MKTKTHRRKSGFTLVEMLLTIVIIAILSGLVVGVSGYANRKSAESQAESDLQQLANILEEYRIEVGSYPSGTGNVTATLFNSGGSRALSLRDEHFKEPGKPYDFTDPWGNDYRYKSISRFSYELYSKGPDGKEDDNPNHANNRDNLYSSQKTTGIN